MRLGHVLYFDIPYFGGTTWLRRYFRSKDKGVLDEAFGTKGKSSASYASMPPSGGESRRFLGSSGVPRICCNCPSRSTASLGSSRWKKGVGSKRAEVSIVADIQVDAVAVRTKSFAWWSVLTSAQHDCL